MNQNRQKRILVTGCSSGIGYDAARQLRDRGYDVIASCRKLEDVTRLQAQGFNCWQIDLADSQSIQAACQRLASESQNHPLYGLVNNGAFGIPGAVEDLSRSALRHQFETNVFGTHELTVGVMPLLRENAVGRVIQISSILGGLSLPFRGAYNASKHALEALSDTLRLELDGSDIHISLIEPGPIATRFRDNAIKQFEQHIDIKNSPFNAYYKAVSKRLSSEKPVPFTLPASAVTQQIIHALESSQPKARYHTTLPTKIFLPLKRLMPDKLFDRLLLILGDRPPKN